MYVQYQNPYILWYEVIPYIIEIPHITMSDHADIDISTMSDHTQN